MSYTNCANAGLLSACRDTVVEITATITTAFLCFWVAEEIGSVSGVLAVVTLSIFMAAVGKYAVSPDVQHSMHAVWDVLEFMANTLVFFYFGVLISVRIYEGHQQAADAETIDSGVQADINAEQEQTLFAKDWGYAVLNWVLLFFIRLIVLALVKPVLSRVGDGFSWKDVLLGTWAGLRGAVGLSLALIVDLASQQPGSTIDSR